MQDVLYMKHIICDGVLDAFRTSTHPMQEVKFKGSASLKKKNR